MVLPNGSRTAAPLYPATNLLDGRFELCANRQEVLDRALGVLDAPVEGACLMSGISLTYT